MWMGFEDELRFPWSRYMAFLTWYCPRMPGGELISLLCEPVLSGGHIFALLMEVFVTISALMSPNTRLGECIQKPSCSAAGDLAQ